MGQFVPRERRRALNLKRVQVWAFLTCGFSLLIGAVTLLWADFGMPGWFFGFTQAWFWTLGLPTMVAVLLVAWLCGIPEWTALPLWAFAVSVTFAALAIQTGCFFVVVRGWQRFTGRP